MECDMNAIEISACDMKKTFFLHTFYSCKNEDIYILQVKNRLGKIQKRVFCFVLVKYNVIDKNVLYFSMFSSVDGEGK